MSILFDVLLNPSVYNVKRQWFIYVAFGVLIVVVLHSLLICYVFSEIKYPDSLLCALDCPKILLNVYVSLWKYMVHLMSKRLLIESCIKHETRD